MYKQITLKYLDFYLFTHILMLVLFYFEVTKLSGDPWWRNAIYIYI